MELFIHNASQLLANKESVAHINVHWADRPLKFFDHTSRTRPETLGGSKGRGGGLRGYTTDGSSSSTFTEEAAESGLGGVGEGEGRWSSGEGGLCVAL